ncbi:MAG: hypothetical protein IPK21_22910 [Haliscomenobacter sp.]|nr:hypothetical protein [Haliscomenobacter sp.]
MGKSHCFRRGLIHTGQGSEAFTLEFAKLIPQALGNSKYLQFAKETLAQAPDQQQQSHAKLLSWLEAYQEFLEKNPLSNQAINRPDEKRLFALFASINEYERTDGFRT